MALLTWRKRNDKGEPQGPTNYLEFDATLLEEFTRAAEVTRFPVESGSVLSDHYQPQPRAITLEVQVSDTPVRPYTPIEGKTSATKVPVGEEAPKDLTPYLRPNVAPVTGVLSERALFQAEHRIPKGRTASVLQFAGGVTRTVDVFKALDDLITSRQLVDVVLFKNVEYKNMVIVNVRTPRDASSGSTLTFTIDLVQVQFADTTTTANPQPSEKKHKPKSDAGNRNPKNDPTANAQANAKGLDWNTST